MRAKKPSQAQPSLSPSQRPDGQILPRSQIIQKFWMAFDGDAIVRELIARRCAAGCLTPPACFVVAFLPPHLRQALLAYVPATPRPMRGNRHLCSLLVRGRTDRPGHSPSFLKGSA